MAFRLVYTVYVTAVDPKKGDVGVIAPISIGFVVGANILAGGASNGASMNPAVSFGPALVSWSWENHWVYWVGPLIGGGLVGLFYELVSSPPTSSSPPLITKPVDEFESEISAAENVVGVWDSFVRVCWQLLVPQRYLSRQFPFKMTTCDDEGQKKKAETGGEIITVIMKNDERWRHVGRSRQRAREISVDDSTQINQKDSFHLDDWNQPRCPASSASAFSGPSLVFSSWI